MVEESKKGFFKRWYDGILNLSIEQQLQAKMFFFIGGALGMLMATISFIVRGSWGFSIFLLCMSGFQVIGYIVTRQQYIQTKKIMDEIKNN